FVSAAASSAGGMARWADPLGMLANHGLGFLLDHCGILKSAMDLVTGDSETVTGAADTWGDVATELKELAKTTEETIGSGLKDWGGQGAQAAGKQLAELVVAIQAIGSEADNMKQLLEASAALMEAALEVVKSIISDLVSWLIITWVAAQVAAVVTVGASEVAALGASVAEITVTSVRVAGKVAEVERVLSRMEQVVARIQRTIGTEAKAISIFRNTVGKEFGGELAKAVPGALADGAKKLGGALVDQGVDNAGSGAPQGSRADINRGLNLG
ncbi:MAG: WXG100 family type VII secretion target, partial [Mycobacteriaceae bacterium]